MFYYDPNSLQINISESVQWNNLSGFHDVIITSGPEDLSLPAVSGPALIGQLTFNTAGVYDYICSIGNHEAQGMVGTIIVGSGGCTDSSACNYNVLSDFNDNSCVFANTASCESCSDGSVVTNDSDDDGICDADDDCQGSFDSCGVCAGNGPDYNCDGNLICNESDCDAGDNTVTVNQSLVAGWNWISTNVINQNMTLNNLFQNAEGSDYIKAQSGYAEYVSIPGAFSGWLGTITNLDIGSGYKAKFGNDYNWSYEGVLTSTNDYTMTLETGWNWIGYIPNESMSLSIALDFTAEGSDYIKGQTGYAEYVSIPGAFSGWLGTITSLDPFIGYMLKVQSDHTFNYPMGTLSRVLFDDFNNLQTLNFNYNKYEFNGSLTAKINSQEIDISNDDLLIAYDDDGEIRGSVNPIFSPVLNEHIFYLMVYGQNDVSSNLNFEYYNKYEDKSYILNNKNIQFESDMIIGNSLDPLVFDINSEEIVSLLNVSKAFPNPFNPSTNLEYSIMSSELVKITVFDVTGRQVSIIENSFKEAGDHSIVWNAQNNTSGIYYIQILAGNEIKTQKVVLLK